MTPIHTRLIHDQDGTPAVILFRTGKYDEPIGVIDLHAAKNLCAELSNTIKRADKIGTKITDLMIALENWEAQP